MYGVVEQKLMATAFSVYVAKASYQTQKNERDLACDKFDIGLPIPVSKLVLLFST